MLKDILKNWSVADQHVKHIKNSNEDKERQTVWFVGDKYILKSTSNLSGLKVHIEISKILVQQGFNASTPVKTLGGKDYVVKDDYYYVLLTKVEGEILEDKNRFNLETEKLSSLYGRSIGKLHRALSIIDVKGIPEKDIEYSLLEWALPESHRRMKDKLEKDLIDYIKTCKGYFKTLDKQVIHRDVHSGNIIFKNGQINGFIDFEISEINVRIFDVCYFLTSLLMEMEDLDAFKYIYKKIISGVLNGFQSELSLTSEEIRAMPYIMYFNELVFIAWAGDKEVYKEMTNKNIRVLTWPWENHNFIFDEMQ